MTHFERQLVHYLLMYVTQRRKDRFAEVLNRRTRRVTVVLEDIYGSHNIGAVLRTCDAFGIQDVHVIEDSHDFQLQPDVALGSQKWLTLHRYHRVPDPRSSCVTTLRQAGYRLLAVTPHADAQPPEEVDVSEPCALLFGAEKDGLTSEITEFADGVVRIPMCGFVESLNVSVAAAVCLYPIVNRLRSGHPDWGLSFPEKELLMLEWLRKSVPHAAALEQRFSRQFTSDVVEHFAPPPPAAADH